jgi:hypothetical protein
MMLEGIRLPRKVVVQAETAANKLAATKTLRNILILILESEAVRWDESRTDLKVVGRRGQSGRGVGRVAEAWAEWQRLLGGVDLSTQRLKSDDST